MDALFQFSHTLLDFRLTIFSDFLSGSLTEIGDVYRKASYRFSNS